MISQVFNNACGIGIFFDPNSNIKLFDILTFVLNVASSPKTRRSSNRSSSSFSCLSAQNLFRIFMSLRPEQAAECRLSFADSSLRHSETFFGLVGIIRATLLIGFLNIFPANLLTITYDSSARPNPHTLYR